MTRHTATGSAPRPAPPLSVVHLGIAEVARAPEAAGVPVVSVDFVPPAGGDPERLRRLATLWRAPLGERIDAANRRALRRMLAARPRLVGVGTAREVIPGLGEERFLHAGPPVEWGRMSGPLRGAVIGGLLLEGRAKTAEEAERLAARGGVEFAPCHHFGAVGPMAGLVTPSMPVFIVEDGAEGHGGVRSYCTLNEGLGKVLRYGAFGPEVIDRLRFMAAELAPALGAALEEHGPVDLRLLIAQALQMGDEGHNRNRAGTSLLIRELAPWLARRGGGDGARTGRVLAFLHANDHFFLNLSMPAAKCMVRAAEGEAGSSLVTVMARNGTDFGIQLASMPGRWFTGPARRVEGLYFPGYGPEDANPDIGDSAITETAGLGGVAMAAAPAIVLFVGGTPQDALETTRRMGRIAVGTNPGWTIPALGFAGTPTGIDLRQVLERNLLPVINTGIAHRKPGVGQVGAGLTSPPWECFHAALDAFAEQVRGTTPDGPEGAAR